MKKTNEILDQARRKLDDIVKPYLWPQEELLTYLNQSIDELCENFVLEDDWRSGISLIGSSNITFSQADKTIIITGGGFRDAGLHTVKEFTVIGTANNNNTFTVSTTIKPGVSDTKIIVDEALVDESDTSAVLTGTEAVCIIPIIASTHTYDYSDRIVRIKRAKLSLDTYPLSILRTSVNSYMDGNYPDWENADDATPWMMLTKGFGNHRFRLYPPPLVNDTLNLVVNRRMMYDITNNDLGQNIPEIPGELHEKLHYGIIHRAYEKQDAETYDVKKALLHKADLDNELKKLSVKICWRSMRQRQ